MERKQLYCQETGKKGWFKSPLKYYPEIGFKKSKLNYQEKARNNMRRKGNQNNVTKKILSFFVLLNEWVLYWSKTETLQLTDEPDTRPLLLIRDGI